MFNFPSLSNSRGIRPPIGYKQVYIRYTGIPIRKKTVYNNNNNKVYFNNINSKHKNTIKFKKSMVQVELSEKGQEEATPNNTIIQMYTCKCFFKRIVHEQFYCNTINLFTDYSLVT